jgi:hypothetical protein
MGEKPTSHGLAYEFPDGRCVTLNTTPLVINNVTVWENGNNGIFFDGTISFCVPPGKNMPAGTNSPPNRTTWEQYHVGGGNTKVGPRKTQSEN